MLPIKQASKSKRALLSSQLLFNNPIIIISSSSCSPLTPPPPPSPCFARFCYYSTAQVIPIQQICYNPKFNVKDVVQSFKEWFKRGNNGFLGQILDILTSQDEVDEVALSQLCIPLKESLVLEVLYYGNGRNDILSCIKFFDWAGRQPGFQHTRATFHAIFKIISKAKLMPVLLDFLDNYMRLKFLNTKLGHGFYTTLVIGYALAGKPLVALQLFGRMRFQGLDLDDFTYHVLLNSLIEDNCFYAVDDIVKQISRRGFQNYVTHSLVVKRYSKQKMFVEAESYLHRAIQESNGYCLGAVVGILVDALCQKGQFDKGGQVIEELRELGMVHMEPAYGVWLRNLAQAGKVDWALEFLKRKRSLEGYFPEVCRYNVLICRLLKENRLTEAFDLLIEMMENGISPDRVTMNAALCFFCKAGMVDVALDLYNSNSEFMLSPNTMACNYLINSLCAQGSIDEAYSVLRNSTEKGYFPGRITFSILADALCREGKLDMMKELIFVALERNFLPSNFINDKFISALCRTRRVVEGYLMHGEFNGMNKVSTKNTCSNLIHGFNKLNKGDIAASLLMEMQDKGHKATRTLFRAVIHSLCEMENPELQFLKLLEIQLSRYKPSCQIYNFFIDGAGHAKKPELAREVFEMMHRSGIKPNLSTYILMLQSYLKNEKISDALNFFDALRQIRKIGRKIYNAMVVGLCKVNKVEHALSFLREMQSNGMVPSTECYEVLIFFLCSHGQYDLVIHLVHDLEKVGCHVTSFIGNTLLFHSLKREDLFDAWLRASVVQNETSSKLSVLGQLIGAFSGGLRVIQKIDNLEEVIEQCFPLDIYTYNMLLRRISMSNVEDAVELFERLCQKGYEPNRWTYDILVHSLFKHGRTDEARRWVDEMFRKGLDPTYRTKLLM